MYSFTLERLLSALVVIGAEAAVLLLVCGLLYFTTKLVLSRLAAAGGRRFEPWSEVLQLKARNILLAAFFLLFAGVLVFNGWLLVNGLDMKAYTVALIDSVTAATWRPIAMAAGKLALAAAGLAFAAGMLRRLLATVETNLNRAGRLTIDPRSLRRLFQDVDRLIANAAGLLLALFASNWFGWPQRITDILQIAVGVYLVIAIGIMVIRCTAIVVDTMDGWTHRSSRRYGWANYYEHLRSLLPTFRLCLEYVLWIAVASLVLLQIGPLRGVSWWGLRLIQVIGIFFAGRVVIELGSVEIVRRMLPDSGLSDAERRRRTTLVPLFRTAFVYAAYFATAVLMLSALGFNALPFLAGAGIIGLVIGFGAQSLIDDVVSGFFILLENNYLVGDVIEVGVTKGVVEAIEFRTTRIRDADGRVHVLRNGAIKPIINYSKDYALAVVPVEVSYDTDLRLVFHTLRSAGERVRASNPDVLADTVIDGITTFGASTMTVRTSTRVKPGRHEGVAAALRLQIKEMFDREAAGAPRTTLVPRRHPGHQGWPPAGQGV